MIRAFIEKVRNSDETLEEHFKNYSDNYSEIQNLYDSRLNRSEALRKKTGFIGQSSNFKLRNTKSDFFEGSYQEKSDDNNIQEKEISKIEELLELRDIAQLSKKITGDENERVLIENNKKFIKLVGEINNIMDKLRKLYIAGYPDTIEIKMTIQDYSSSFYEGANPNSLDYKNILFRLTNKLSNLKDTQINAYERKPLIRYLYGRQFNLIKDMNNANKDNIYSFLMYFTRNLMTNQIDNIDFLHINDIRGLIDHCEGYLNNILITNNITLQTLYQNSLIHENYDYKGLYINFVNKIENIEKDLFLIYKYLTKNFPVSQNILLCTKDTSNEELTAFLYRAILCPYNACFIMGGIEFLESDRRTKISELLNKLFVDKYEKMKSCLIILYTNKNTDIYKSLDSLDHRKLLEVQRSEYSNIKISKDESKVEIIDSDKSGAGKSRKIEEDIKRSNKKYIYFPFGGVIKRDEIIKRLKK